MKVGGLVALLPCLAFTSSFLFFFFLLMRCAAAGAFVSFACGAVNYLARGQFHSECTRSCGRKERLVRVRGDSAMFGDNAGTRKKEFGNCDKDDR